MTPRKSPAAFSSHCPSRPWEPLAQCLSLGIGLFWTLLISGITQHVQTHKACLLLDKPQDIIAPHPNHTMKIKLKLSTTRAGVTAQWLGAPAALGEDPGSIPSTTCWLTAILNSVSRASSVLLLLWVLHTCSAHTSMQTNICTPVIKHVLNLKKGFCP